MKEQRSISGVYFRYFNPESDKWENWCFEDLPEFEQDKIMQQRSAEWLRNMIKTLANTINQVAETFNITAKREDT